MVSPPDTRGTRWTAILGAARGNVADRETFVQRYRQVVRDYLRARWKRSPLRVDIEDAVQEVFLECFKEGGVLSRVEMDRPGGFRAFLYGVMRTVALGFERKLARDRIRQPAGSWHWSEVPADDEGLSTVFDRAWAVNLLKEAAQLQAERAGDAGEEARRRVELLRLRFTDGRPIREIARLWGVDPAHLHHEYAKARLEFRSALFEVVSFHHPGSPGEVQRECVRLLDYLA
ncbi:MAG: sigma-70 family RNA polymerase sigma factor [Planctomycetota bacterium]